MAVDTAQFFNGTCGTDEECPSEKFCYSDGCDCDRLSALHGNRCDELTKLSPIPLVARGFLVLGYTFVIALGSVFAFRLRKRARNMRMSSGARTTAYRKCVGIIACAILGSACAGASKALGVWQTLVPRRIEKVAYVELCSLLDVFGAAGTIAACVAVGLTWIELAKSSARVRASGEAGRLRCAQFALHITLLQWLALNFSLQAPDVETARQPRGPGSLARPVRCPPTRGPRVCVRRCASRMRPASTRRAPSSSSRPSRAHRPSPPSLHDQPVPTWHPPSSPPSAHPVP